MDMNFGFNDMGDVDAHTGGSRQVPDSGDYNVMISDIEMQSNRAGNGHNIVVTYSIVDGDYAGTEVKEWLAVINKNDTAQNIAQSKLKAIYLVTGKTSARSFTELNGAILRVRLYKKENRYQDSNGNWRDGFNNEVVTYMDTQGRNPQGKEVPAYTGPDVHGASKSQKTATASTSSGNSSNQTHNGGQSSGFDGYGNDDDDIPF